MTVLNTLLLRQKFPLGQVIATPSALGAIRKIYPKEKDVREFYAALLCRHATGDWGNLDAEGKAQNDTAVTSGERLLSSYDTPAGKIWVITEWDRSVTTILLPDDY